MRICANNLIISIIIERPLKQLYYLCGIYKTADIFKNEKNNLSTSQ